MDLIIVMATDVDPVTLTFAMGLAHLQAIPLVAIEFKSANTITLGGLLAVLTTTAYGTLIKPP